MNEIVSIIPALLIWVGVGASFISRQINAERPFFWASLAAHLASAVGIVLVTEVVYGGGDLTSYAAMGRFLADKLRSDFFDYAPALLNVVFQSDKPFPIPGPQVGSNTGSMQALSAFFMLLCNDSLYAACVMIGGLNFLTKVAVYRALRQQLPDVPLPVVAVPCLLLPSAVFWSSGLLKESIAVIGLGMMVSGGAKLGQLRNPIQNLLVLGIGATIVFLIKGYLLPPFGIGVGLWFIARAVQRRGREVVLHTRYLVLGTLIAISLVVATGAYLPQFSPETFADEARNAQEIGARMNATSNYSLGGGSVASQLPLAILTVLFRPIVFESTSLTIFVNSLEMTWLTYLAGTVLFRRSIGLNVREILRRPAIAFCVGFVLTLAVGVGLTTVNLGTLSRYRMPLMPFYALVLFVLAYRPQPSEAQASAPTLSNQPRAA